MKRTHTGLFASHIASMTSAILAGKLVGRYDPIEQLWYNENCVLAGEECKPPLQSCTENDECCADLCVLGVCL